MLRFILVLGPLLVCVIDVVSFSVVDPFVFLLMQCILVCKDGGFRFYLLLVFFSVAITDG